MAKQTSDTESVLRADASPAGSPPPRGWWADLVLATAIAVAALAVYAPLASLGLKFGDDGYLAYGVERIL